MSRAERCEGTGRLSHAAFDHDLNVELASDLAWITRRPLVLHDDAASVHAERAHDAQEIDQIR